MMNKRQFYNWSRLLHIYMSTALFSLLIFFSVTGITLNHLEWVSTTNEPKSLQDQLPNSVLNKLKPPISEALLIWLDTKYGLSSATNIEWDQDNHEILLDYPYPAGYAYVIVNINNGQLTIDYQNGQFWQVVNDLHKGRHAGKAWSWLIDISAGFMVFFSITGLIILWQNRPKRKLGIALTVLGTVTPVFIFILFVPKLSGA
ncbi:PepSY-associated TM helix domain-containing protein [Catenovulum maritimum]|uniref:Peptidase n=1 Tax=Catenovulum maritimum TaxID=1513271 RepID=A0A0J8GMG0_9ALTE|nr:hypothetical protein XM47_16805 [Catenovulum maritimum]